MPSAQSLSDRMRARGFHRGLLGTSRPWLAVWIVLVTAHYARKYLGPNKVEVVYSEELLPGESLLITHENREP